jgi:hypothetical protein
VALPCTAKPFAPANVICFTLIPLSSPQAIIP